MSSDPNIEAQGNGDAPRINIDYIKAHHFRTIAPTGLMTSVTPQGQVQIGLFSERQPIPQRVVFALNPDGGLGEKIETIGREAVVREVEAVITLDGETAAMLARSLVDLLKELSAHDGEEEKA